MGNRWDGWPLCRFCPLGVAVFMGADWSALMEVKYGADSSMCGAGGLADYFVGCSMFNLTR